MNIAGILEALRSTLLAFIVFALVPILWWAIKGRKQSGFFKYFGLTKPRADNASVIIAIAIYCAVWLITHLPFFTRYTQPSANQYTGLGVSVLLPILIISFLQTAALEEFLFRGFINKRFVNLFGLYKGVLLQSAIFGGIHVLLASEPAPLAGGIIFFTTAIGGFMLGYIAEKSWTGSILPGILLHGLGNCIINLLAAFSCS